MTRSSEAQNPVSRTAAGTIVIVDWRSGALGNEPTKARPAITIEDHELFPADYLTTLVVPLTHDAGLAHAAFSVRIDPTPENGVDETCWALAHNITSVSLRRVRVTESTITSSELAEIRSRVALAIGAGG